MAPQRIDERSVTRTYRTAIRLGEDFITLEETITLPLDASDEEVQRAVDLGWRIYQAQREALEHQVASVRETQIGATPIMVRDPDSPASEKQRNYIGALQDDLTWTSEQLATYAVEHGIDIVNMTKGQASGFIDSLKKLAEERSRYGDTSRSRGSASEATPSVAETPITERQRRALLKLAQDRGFDLEAETQQRFGVDLEAMSSEQASALLSEWQRTARNGSGRHTVSEAAL
ncbi:MAG: hypothetical protein MI924_28035 [Chloroflexales bacterium]|nr:hypothetical protein [Chloroflexales bacterium]